MTVSVPHIKKPKLSRLFIAIAATIVIVIICAGYYGYNEFTRSNKSLKNTQSDIAITTDVLFRKFITDYHHSDSVYKNKVVELTGVVTKIDFSNESAVIFFDDKNLVVSIQCSMDMEYRDNYQSLVRGSVYTVRGIYIGAISNDIFGTDIKFNRCVIVNKKLPE
jgi:tRNA_anti-like